ncbi:hypothetical protein COU57_03890 [Candidatus Pacearchaeota archaeon CG10_big_fil_rev_8_21_14_0_10_32_14]|nr:MAG: hypothetical protein COU57_03890 [Candidatus Pacearchaeota archaeon CG10_big_fil_rev_8_21_14_0_10_32_14]
MYDIQEADIYGAYKIFFGTLVSGSRLKIINLLRNGKRNVSEIMEELDMDQTCVSHDLARLKQCGFVNMEIDGKYRNYTLNNETIKPLMDIIDKHMSGNCVHILKKEIEVKAPRKVVHSFAIDKEKQMKGGKKK